MDTGADHAQDSPNPSTASHGNAKLHLPLDNFYSQNAGIEASRTSLADGLLCINPKLLRSANKSKIVTDPVVLCAGTDFSTLHSLIKTR